MEEIQYLTTLENILAQHRAFGDSAYIHQRLHVTYQRRLGKISAHLPTAAAVLDGLCRGDTYDQYRVIGDTVVRCSIDDALRQIEMETSHGFTLDECDEVFRAIVRYFEDGKSGGPLGSGFATVNRLGREAHHGWIWSHGHYGDVFGRAFRRTVQECCGELCEPELELCAPTNEELFMLSKGALLLGDLLPLLAPSALRHTHLITVFPSGAWKGAASFSQFWLGGTIFLGREFLQSPWWVAEHLLHESLHQKLYDFHHGHSLLEPDFSRENAPKICSLWNVPGTNNANLWDTHRAVAAFHVYVHLALLATTAEERAAELEKIYGSKLAKPRMISSRRAMERAHFLGEQIKESCWDELGLAGKRLIEWLISVLNALDPDPPPKGAYIYLLLDRYRGEAQMAERKAQSLSNGCGRESKMPISPDFVQQLRNLVKREVDSARSALSAVDAKDDVSRFNAAIGQYSDEELGTKFSQVRALIAKAIFDLYPNGSSGLAIPGWGTAEKVVKDMIEDSSVKLQKIMRGQTA
jgi:hypothetical protein